MKRNKYRHLCYEEREMIAMMRTHRLSLRTIAKALKRSPSTISREIRRNAYVTDGYYRTRFAQENTNERRRRARYGTQFSKAQWRIVIKLLKEQYSPEQVSGYLALEGILQISHETIYRYIWCDRASGGKLYKHLRQSPKIRRKRYGAKDSRGRLAGKRMIEARPKIVDKRSRVGDWEIDTVAGSTRACILTVVDRKSGFVVIGKLPSRKAEDTNNRLKQILDKYSGRFKTITADNGSEFHGYKAVEQSKKITFYFAQPYHSWERGTNENTNGLIRQYLPKGTSMDDLSQHQCNAIADKLNSRPRKRHGFKTPNDIFYN